VTYYTVWHSACKSFVLTRNTGRHVGRAGISRTFNITIVIANLNSSHVYSLRTWTYFLTHLLTLWSRILEKLTGLHLVQKFSSFYATRKSTNAFTSAHHLSLSRAGAMQPILPHPTSWRSSLLLSSHLILGLPSGLFPSGFPTQTVYTPLLSPIRARPTHLILLHFITRTILGEGCLFGL
jgi:hypothetical protein